jgi:hypothetical protein
MTDSSQKMRRSEYARQKEPKERQRLKLHEQNHRKERFEDARGGITRKVGILKRFSRDSQSPTRLISGNEEVWL